MRRKARRLKRIREEEERVKDRDLIKTVEEVFDAFTMGHLYSLERRGIIWELKGVVSSGKEARIYWGRGRKGEDLAVKIYLSATAEFRRGIRKYIIGDPRFEEISPSNFRKLIYEWARKEYRNLKRMKEAGVRVPSPISYSGNIVVMEFLGENGYRAPLLYEVVDELTREDIRGIYEDLLEQLNRIVCKARLVHADLSEYNIMYWRGKPWVIDVAQAVHHGHPHALEFLERDIWNIHKFFSQHVNVEPLDKLKRVYIECLSEEGEREELLYQGYT